MTLLFRLIAAAALVACLQAATTGRRPAAPVRTASIQSSDDKFSKQRAMTHPAFQNAGTKKGTEIWRIENFEPVAVPSKDAGKFYSGDSYIVMNTRDAGKGQLSWDIHYWLGSQTSQDEAGAAAILSVGLDDKLGGAPVQHREVQGHESTQFLGYFKPAIRYLDGGHASGFSHVTTNAGAEKRLFQIKGKKNIRVRQIAPSIASMNKGDCFILDIDQDIYVYVGEKAKRVEKLKAISVANQIRDQDHNGRAKVEVIDEFSNEADTSKFFTALGGGSRDSVPEETAGGDDQAFERTEEQSVALYEVSDRTGKLVVTPLSKPYKQEQLSPDECYILDSISGGIYVWVGKKCTQQERSQAISKADEYLSSKNYPAWVHVTRMPQGTESAAFKQYFFTWRDVGMTHSRLVRSPSDEDFYSSDVEVSDNKAKKIGKTGSAHGFMPDQGEGQAIVYRIENLELVEVYRSDSIDEDAPLGQRFGNFYQGDSYVVQYNYQSQGKNGYIIYYWLGKDSTLDEKAAAAMHTVALDAKMNGAAIQIRVPQGEEPKHFLKVFKGRLVTFLGGKGSAFRNSNQKDSYDDDGTRLFRVLGAEAGVDTRAEQVPEVAASLTDDEVYILETPGKLYVWRGKDATEEEKQESLEFVSAIFGSDAKPYLLEQGSETDEFWNALGGQMEHTAALIPAWRRRLNQRIGSEPRLLEVSLNSLNQVGFEELDDFKQQDLSDENVYLLDTSEEIYFWIGDFASQHEKKSVNTIVQEYLKTDQLGRTPSSAVTVSIKQGHEPEVFKRMFQRWDDDMWKKQKSYEDIKNQMLETNEI